MPSTKRPEPSPWPLLDVTGCMRSSPRLVLDYGPPALAALLLGLLVTNSPDLAILFLALVVGTAALASPTAAWVATALVVALTFKGLVTLGVLPGVATYIDIPVAWGAF